MASAKKKSSSKDRSRVAEGSGTRPQQARFAVCICNDDYPASLETRKLYRVLEDDFAEQHGMIRVVDESDEDYLYPQSYFVRIDIPRSLEIALQKTA